MFNLMFVIGLAPGPPNGAVSALHKASDHHEIVPESLLIAAI
jgi:hypothetical protein